MQVQDKCRTSADVSEDFDFIWILLRFRFAGCEYRERMGRPQQTSLLEALIAGQLVFTIELIKALITAARDGDVAKVKQLLAEGTPVNEGGANGMTPLHWAS